jgi:deoxyribodipyrimidine photo-lyase
VGAEGIALSGRRQRYARRREQRLRAGVRPAPDRAAAVPRRDGRRSGRAAARRRRRALPGLLALPPGLGRAKWRDEVATPRTDHAAGGRRHRRLPAPPDGESPGRGRGRRDRGTAPAQGVAGHLDAYDDLHDDLAADGTSRLSPYLRFGCLSPLAVARAARDGRAEAGRLRAPALLARLLLPGRAAFPALSTEAYRPAGDDEWRDDPEALRHWQDGMTGVPVVDAGMRQLRAEGWMHNRARLITAAFLTKHLGLDWRHGVRWFFRWLLDGDVPNNSGNWQWVAGTGQRHQALPALQPDPAGRAVRPRRQVRSALRSRIDIRARQSRAPALATTGYGSLRPRLSGPAGVAPRRGGVAAAPTGRQRVSRPARRTGCGSGSCRPVAFVR